MAGDVREVKGTSNRNKGRVMQTGKYAKVNDCESHTYLSEL